ncbi:MAG: FIST C-terminal domain-containing protein [Fusobacteriaceae bacterium]|nr:FIST C-terminal domain-containing protein [Fusobacteriaceae bacterium]
MYFKSFFSKGKNEKDVVDEIYSKLNNSEVKILLFFSSTNYDFSKITSYFNEKVNGAYEIIGCTTSGEIAQNSGITKGGISAIAMGEPNMKIGVVPIEEINRIPLLSRKPIIETIQKLGYSPNQSNYKDLASILLIDGLHGAEEKVLSIINSIFDGNLDLIGGSAGDDLKFKQTLVSYNGIVYENSAILSFIKTTTKFKLYKENIFIPQGITMNITKADEKSRKIIEIDEKPAKTRYAELLGVNKNDLEKSILKNPIGRRIGDNTYISSIAGIDGETLNMYAQVFENTQVEILLAKDPLEVQLETINQIRNDFSQVEGMFCVNCILRFLQFEAEGTLEKLSNGLSSLGEYGGFVSYGEQNKKQHFNQTLTMLVFGRD